MTSKLLPCPFCNGKAVDHDYGQEYWVQCQECGVRSGSTTNRETADTWWNLRAAPLSPDHSGGSREVATEYAALLKRLWHVVPNGYKSEITACLDEVKELNQ